MPAEGISESNFTDEIETIQIFIRPIDPNNNSALATSYEQPPWIMGEDMILNVDPMTSISDLKGIIEIYKHYTEHSTGSNLFISRHRMQLRVNGKSIIPSKENWTLRRLGIFNGMIIQVEPTFSGDWYWHSYDHYVERLVEKVLDIVRSREYPCMISMSELSDAVGPLPPPIQTNLKTFLRRYPEKLNIYCDCSGFESVYWVQETTHPRMTPRFDEFPVDIGTTPRFHWADFDWDQYRDIDDMYREETLDGPQRDEEEETEEDKEVKALISALLSDMVTEIEDAEGEDEGRGSDTDDEDSAVDDDGSNKEALVDADGPAPPSDSSSQELIDESQS